jgi:hypothetical protein
MLRPIQNFQRARFLKVAADFVPSTRKRHQANIGNQLRDFQAHEWIPDDIHLSDLLDQHARLDVFVRNLIYSANPTLKPDMPGTSPRSSGTGFYIWTDTSISNAAIEEVFGHMLGRTGRRCGINLSPIKASKPYRSSGANKVLLQRLLDEPASPCWLPGDQPCIAELGCIERASFLRYAPTIAVFRTKFFLLENGMAPDLSVFRTKFPASPGWAKLLRDILKVRAEGRIRQYYLPPNVHAVLSSGAKTIFSSHTSPMVFKSLLGIMDVLCNVTLTLHIIENRTAPEISHSTAANAVALMTWLVDESERVLDAITSEDQVGTNHSA